MKEKLQIIKIGGNIVADVKKLNETLKLFAALKTSKILIHGGGKEATKLASKMGIEVKMVDGRRITDKNTLDIATMVYAGKINKTIVAQLQKFNCNSIGLSGADGNTIIAKKREVKEIDYGFVGDVEKVNIESIKVLIKNNITPVFCSLTHDKNGQILNTNADTITSELGIALSKNYDVDIFYLFEENGVLRDRKDKESVIEKISIKNYQELIDKKIIIDGMLPKIHNCLYAIKNGVQKIHIGNYKILKDKTIKHTIILVK